MGHQRCYSSQQVLGMGWIGFFWSDTAFTHLGPAAAWLILS